jgi:hypothetical protein
VGDELHPARDRKADAELRRESVEDQLESGDRDATLVAETESDVEDDCDTESVQLEESDTDDEEVSDASLIIAQQHTKYSMGRSIIVVRTSVQKPTMSILCAKLFKSYKCGEIYHYNNNWI